MTAIGSTRKRRYHGVFAVAFLLETALVVGLIATSVIAWRTLPLPHDGWAPKRSHREVASSTKPLSWPSVIAHASALPEPAQVIVAEEFARREVWVFQSQYNRRLRRVANVQWIGWPRPVVQRIRIDLPPEKAELRSLFPADTAYQVVWFGVLVDTAIFASVFVSPFAAAGTGYWGWRALRRWRRARRGECRECGYPVGLSDVCSECGLPINPKAAATLNTRSLSDGGLGAFGWLLCAESLVVFGLIISMAIAWRAVPDPGATDTLKQGVMVHGDEAATKAWPAESPHAKPWPAINSYMVRHEFGRTHYDARHVDENHQSTYSMTVDSFGWPFPALRHAQFWWPGDDPAWATTSTPDSGVEIDGVGWALDTLAFSTVSGLLLLLLRRLIVIGNRRSCRVSERGSGSIDHSMP